MKGGREEGTEAGRGAEREREREGGRERERERRGVAPGGNFELPEIRAARVPRAPQILPVSRARAGRGGATAVIPPPLLPPSRIRVTRTWILPVTLAAQATQRRLTPLSEPEGLVVPPSHESEGLIMPPVPPRRRPPVAPCVLPCVLARPVLLLRAARPPRAMVRAPLSTAWLSCVPFGRPGVTRMFGRPGVRAPGRVTLLASPPDFVGVFVFCVVAPGAPRGCLPHASQGPEYRPVKGRQVTSPSTNGGETHPVHRL